MGGPFFITSGKSLLTVALYLLTISLSSYPYSVKGQDPNIDQDLDRLLMAPVDVYHLFDRSFSMRTAYDRHIDFAINMTQRLGNLLGYQKDSNSIGLRVSSIGFACRNEKKDDTRVFMDRTGNVSLIERRFYRTRRVRPNKGLGHTCIEPAIRLVEDMINNETGRVNLVIIYTDGEAGDFNKGYAGRENGLKSFPHTLVFAVGTVTGNRNKKNIENKYANKLGPITGNANNVFLRANENTQSKLIKTASQFVSVERILISAVDYETKSSSLVCPGSNVSLKIDYSFENVTSFECHIENLETGQKSISTGYQFNKEFYCDYNHASSIYSQENGKAQMNLFVTNENERKLLGVYILSVRLDHGRCIDYSLHLKENNTCTGDDTNLKISGKLLETAQTLPDIEVQCVIYLNKSVDAPMSIVPAISTSTSGSFICKVESSQIIHTLIGDQNISAESVLYHTENQVAVNVVEPTFAKYFSIALRNASSDNLFVFDNLRIPFNATGSDIKDACLSTSIRKDDDDLSSNQTNCLYSESTLNLAGETVNLGLSIASQLFQSGPSGLVLKCLISIGNSTLTVGAAETDDGISCTIPRQHSNPLLKSNEQINGNVALLLVKGSKRPLNNAIALSEMIPFTMPQEELCLDFDIGNSTFQQTVGASMYDLDECWGSNVMINPKLPKGLLVRVSGPSVKLLQDNFAQCSFRHTAGKILANATITEEGIECKLPSQLFQSPSETIGFELLINESHIKDIQGPNITIRVNNVAPCLETRVFQGNNAQEYISSNGLYNDICFGAPGIVQITGKSVPSIIHGKKGLECIFASSSNIRSNLSVPVATELFKVSSSTQEALLQCALPSDASSISPIYDVLYIKNEAISISIPFNSSYRINMNGDSCIETINEIEDHEGLNSSSYICAGDLLKTKFKGIGMQPRLLNDTTCVYNNQEGSEKVIPATSESSGEFSCTLPKWSPFSAEGRSNIKYTSLTLNVSNISVRSTTLPRFDVCLAVSSHGILEADRPVRKLQQTSFVEEEVLDCWPYCCKRDSVSISFSGRSIPVLTEQPERFRCAFHNEGQYVYSGVTFISPDELVCESVPGWRPGEANAGDYDAVSVQLLANEQEKPSESVFNLTTHKYFPTTGNKNCLHVTFNPEQCEGNMSFHVQGLTLDAVNAYALESGRYTDDLVDCRLHADLQEMNLSSTFANNSLVCTRENTSPGIISQPSLLVKINDGNSSEMNQYTMWIQNFTSALTIKNCTIETGTEIVTKSTLDTETAIIVGVFAGVASLLLFCCIFFVCRKANSKTKGKQKRRPKVENPAEKLGYKIESNNYPSVPDNFKTQSVRWVYGTRVEALFRHSDGQNNSESCDSFADAPAGTNADGWYKGTIIKPTEAGWYEVRFDEEFEKLGKMVISASALRTPETDYSRHDIVEVKVAQLGEEEDEFLFSRATIIERKKNDHYLVEKQDGLSSVPGSEVRPALTAFERGEVVMADVDLNGTRGTNIGVIAGVHIQKQKSDDYYDIKPLDPEINMAFRLPADRLTRFELIPGEPVEMKDENDSAIWHQVALLKYTKGSMTCDVLKANVRISDVPVYCIRKKTYQIGEDVEVLLPRDDSLAVVYNMNAFSHESKLFDDKQPETKIIKPSEEDTVWLPGKVLEANPDGVSYKVELLDKSRPTIQFAVVGNLRPKLLKKAEQNNNNDNDDKHEKTITFLRFDENGNAFLVGPEEDTDKITYTDMETNKSIDYNPTIWRPPVRPQAELEQGSEKSFLFRKKAPIEYRELTNNSFKITVDKSKGLGVCLGLTTDNWIIIARFLELKTGEWGPLEATGLVGLKDHLIGVNGIKIDKFSFAKASEMIRCCPNIITLEIERWSEKAV